MIADHGDAVEADLARYYHLNLADHYRGRLSLRRLRSLIGWLPEGSAVRAVEDANQAEWEAKRRVADIENALAVFKS